MSVFRLQEWWSTQVANEEFASGCMAVGNLDNSREASDKIALGSLEGSLRVYHPSSASFRVDDLLIGCDESFNCFCVFVCYVGGEGENVDKQIR